jgi:ABC-type Fe3+/spermidine/putrescine transport system ATPase subunit
MQTEISTLVRSAGATTIYITHDQSEAFALADQVGVLDKGRLVQFGSPEEIYRSPANSFVARFTGLSGEFPVRVEGAATSPGRILVVADLEGAQGAIEVTAGAGAPSKGPAVLLVRRSAVTLRSPDDGSVHLRGSVEDVAYRGRNYEVTIDLGGGCRLGGVQCDDRMPRGTSVGLQLDPQGCMVFDNEPAPADAGESGGGAERTDVRVQRLEATEAAVGYSTM